MHESVIIIYLLMALYSHSKFKPYADKTFIQKAHAGQSVSQNVYFGAMLYLSLFWTYTLVKYFYLGRNRK